MDNARTVITWSARPAPSELDAWDALVQGTPYSDVSQLTAWARVRGTAGFSSVFLLAHRGSTLVGGALVLTRRLPVVGPVGYVPYGPVVVSDAPRDEVVGVLTAALEQATRTGLRMLFVQPPHGAEDVSAALLDHGFRPSRAGIAPAASLRLDLEQSEEALRAGLRRRLQRWTRTWPSRGVEVRQGANGDVALLARFHAETAAHQGFAATPPEYLEALHEHLAAGGHARLFVGQVDGTPVAARLFTVCGGVVKDRFAGMDRASEAARLNVPAAIYWEAIRWAKAGGYRWFDLGGVSSSALPALLDTEPESVATTPLTGSQTFKASFGAEAFRYPTPMERISSPLVRKAYDLSQDRPATRRLVQQAAHRLRAGGWRRRGTTGGTPSRA